MTDIELIEPITIDEVDGETFKLICNSPITLYPKKFLDTNDLIVEYDPWGICVITKSREKLIQSFKEELITVWKLVVLTHNPLSEMEISLKENLWNDFSMMPKEIKHLL